MTFGERMVEKDMCQACFSSAMSCFWSLVYLVPIRVWNPLAGSKD